MPETPTTAGHAGYGVVLVRREIDRFNHNDLFANELKAAFGRTGMEIRVLDYRAEVGAVFEALRSRDSLFFLCFNGFGSEISFAQYHPGSVASAYEAFGKPLFDLMHDCPAHETMAHQVDSIFPSRHLLMADTIYAFVARQLGMRNVHVVPTIAFPETQHQVVPSPLAGREVEILLPVGLQSPDHTLGRYELFSKGTPKQKAFRAVFESVAEECLGDLSLSPVVQLLATARDIGLDLDFRRVDDRFLLSTILDYVKFEGRRRLVANIAHLPVTIMTDRPIDELTSGTSIRTLPPRSAAALTSEMGRAKIVICPTPHVAVFHERPFMAFTAGSVVVSSPSEPMETAFRHGEDMLFYRHAADLPAILAGLLENPERMQAIADRGREKALTHFSPARLTETILSLLLQRQAVPLQTRR